MKRFFVFLIIFSTILVLANCTISSNLPTVIPTLTSTTVHLNTPVVKNTLTPTSTSIVETDVPVSPSVEMPIGDGGLLSGEPCESPCFFGIRLGETKFDEIIPILKKNGLSPCFKDLRSENWISIVCGIDKPRVRIDVREDILTVDGIGYSLSNSITVGDIIAKYGEPNRVEVLYRRDESNTLFTYAILYWDSLAMEVSLSEVKDIGDETYSIENTTKAKSIQFSEEETYMKYYLYETEAWKGYGIYNQ